jgi:alpha-mannosidase/mannosylglycerate hydrolase
VLPDEWLVSGESLVRNLRRGRRVAREFGATPSSAGFVCDLFGHIGQLPQILAGFGVKGALVWRGVEPREQAHFVWRASDGTGLPCYRFGRTGYCDYDYDVRFSHVHSVRFAAAKGAADLRAFLDREAARSTVRSLIVFDGGDHLEYDQDHYDLLMGTRPGKQFPYQVVHSTLDAYLEEMAQHAADITASFEGEMRETGRLPVYKDQQWLIPGVLSSRVWIKQSNAECETLLCHWAEPVGAMAHRWLAREYPAVYLDVAWRWLLMNHPHDSICGCSIDEVHEDMKYRFAQCRQIARRQTLEAARALAAAVAGEVGDRELRVMVLNPLPRELDEPLELVLQVPSQWPCFNEFFGFETKPAFRVFAADGKELPYQRLAQAMNRPKVRIHRTKFPQGYATHDVTVCLRLRVPALGYTTLTVRAETPVQPSPVFGPMIEPTRHPDRPGLATSECSLANEFLAVRIAANGTLTLHDRRTDELYEGLLTFEDCADIGDGWYHGQAVNDQAFVSSAARSDIALVHDGPSLARFRIRTVMGVPREFDFPAMRRSETMTDLIIDSLVTLRAGCPRIEVETRVRNAALDHRLRVLLPTRAESAICLADGAYDVVERPIALPTDNHLGREIAVETKPMQTWAAVADPERGLAVLSSGQLEFAVRDTGERPLALTLFRGTRRTVMTSGQPNGQLSGDLTFRYWIVPTAAPVDRAGLCQLGTLLAAGVQDVQLQAEDVPLYRTDRRLPAAASFLALHGDVVMTSARQEGPGLEVRLFNPLAEDARAVLDLTGWPAAASPPSRVGEVDFEGNPRGPARALKGGKASLTLGPKQIMTLRLE